MRPELGLDTAVRYTNLPKTFIAGSVYFADSDECATDALVTVTEGSEARTTKTNAFGDFEVDGLASGKTYGLRIERPGYAAVSQSVTPDGDTYLGDIALKKA